MASLITQVALRLRKSTFVIDGEAVVLGPERDTPECRPAIQMLIDAAEDRGPMLFAKVGIERAFYREVVHVPYPKSSDIGRAEDEA